MSSYCCTHPWIAMSEMFCPPSLKGVLKLEEVQRRAVKTMIREREDNFSVRIGEQIRSLHCGKGMIKQHCGKQ